MPRAALARLRRWLKPAPPLGLALCATGCFVDDLPGGGAEDGEHTSVASTGEPRPGSSGDGEDTTGGSVDGSTDGSTDGSADGSADMGVCEPSETLREPDALPADLVLAVDPGLSVATSETVAAALATVATPWMDADAHLAFLAPDGYAPPWADRCATAVDVVLPEGDPLHPLQQMHDHAASTECSYRPPGASIRQYAVISNRDAGATAELSFVEDVLGPALQGTVARFNVAHDTACGGGGMALEGLAVGTCGRAASACDPQALEDFLLALAQPRAACDWPLDVPRGHTAEEYSLEVEVISQGIAFFADRVADQEACSDSVDPTNREYYFEAERVVLCPAACCLAQLGPVQDLAFHESFSCL